MTEDDLDARDATGAPLLELLVVGLALLEIIAVTVAAWWLW
jgi:hypothetical protein